MRAIVSSCMPAAACGCCLPSAAQGNDQEVRRNTAAAGTLFTAPALRCIFAGQLSKAYDIPRPANPKSYSQTAQDSIWMARLVSHEGLRMHGLVVHVLTHCIPLGRCSPCCLHSMAFYTTPLMPFPCCKSTEAFERSRPTAPLFKGRLQRPKPT
jgi:hypothetical protein